MSDEIEDLKNDIGNLNGTSIIDYALKKAYLVERKSKLAPSPIWPFLTLIQFSILYTRESKLLPDATENDNKRLLNRIERLQDGYLLKKFPLTNDTQVRKFFSVLSKQQFWQFESSPQNDIARQMILFVDLDSSNKSFDNLLKEKYGISVTNFLKLGYVCCLYNTQEKFTGEVDVRLLSLLGLMATNKDIDDFLTLLSLGKVATNREDLSKILELDSPRFHPFDVSVWIKKPFLWWNGKYRLISSNVFLQTIKYTIFDLLRSEEKFASNFSKDRFEKYVEMGLNEIGATFRTENDLKITQSNGVKVIDFLIDDNVLIECKATQLNGIASVQPSDESLRKSLKTSVIKGFEQIYEVSRRMSSKGQVGIVLTYKPMYLGDGSDFSNEVLSTLFSTFSDEDFKRLPKENLFVLSIDEWDKLVQFAKLKKYSIYKAIMQVKEKRDSKGGMYFQNCLQELVGKRKIPTFNFLKERFKTFELSLQERKESTPSLEE